MDNLVFSDRSERLLGKDAIEVLSNSTIAIFGLGGVGSFATEAVVRLGVGTIIITDFDVVDITNVNRQLYALHSTIGKKKTDIAYDRVRDINPKCNIHKHTVFVSDQNINLYDIYQIDCVIDCIDSIESKISLIEYMNKRGIPVITSMGAANKTDPSAIKTADIHKTHQCPLAKKVRKGLRERNVMNNVTAIYSTEAPIKPSTPGPLGSIATIPSIFGLYCASSALKILTSHILPDIYH